MDPPREASGHRLAAATVTVRVVDKGANKLLKDLAVAALATDIGIMGSEAGDTYEGGGMTTAEVAERHEFGIGVPQRSWLRGYVDENESIIMARLRAISDSIARGKGSLRIGLEQLGVLTVGEIQERISNRIAPALAEATIKRKGSDVPLIDTGQLRSSVTHIVKAIR